MRKPRNSSLANRISDVEERLRQLEQRLAQLERVSASRSPNALTFPADRGVASAEQPATAPSPSELVTSLGHELNQPLTAIITFARACLRLLRAGQVDSNEFTAALEEIVSEAEYANRFLRHVRGQLTSGTVLRSSVQLNSQIEQALRRCGQRIRSLEVNLEKQLREDLPTVWGDAVQLEQVLLNLIGNALDAMSETPTGRRKLSIRTTLADGNVTVAVADTGSGFTEDVGQKLFKPTRSAKPAGLGVGLSLCRSIVEAHGGRIWASRNDPPPGATFFITLPALGST